MSLLLNPRAISETDAVQLGWELGSACGAARFGEELTAAARMVACWQHVNVADKAKLSLWLQAASAELMVLAMTDAADALIHANAVEAVLPAILNFGGGPLMPLLAKRCAVALVPFTTEGAVPTGFLDHIWLVAEDADGECDLHEFAAWHTGKPCRVVQVKWRPANAPPPGGRSWQLPVSLAWKALTTPEPEMRPALAASWITTGKVTGDAVEKVRVEGKRELEGLSKIRRRWLLPWGTEPGCKFELATKGGRLCYAQTTDGAWRHITGKYVTSGGEEPWPQNVDTLHIFVSRALGPMLLSAILALPRRVVLWASEEMQAESVALQMALEELQRRGLPVQKVEPVENLPTRDIAETQQWLVEKGQVNAAGCNMFNVTGGNLLMRYALADLAQVNPDLLLVYRDINAGEVRSSENMPAMVAARESAAKSLEFTRLKYENRQGHTARLLPWRLPESIAATWLVNLGRDRMPVRADDLTGCFPDKLPNLAEIRSRGGLSSRV